MHYLLMGSVSLTVVGAFESVGAILVLAMLVVPPAAAYLLTDRLHVMLLLGVALGILSALLGYGLAYRLDASIAGAMAVVAGGLLLLAFLLSPRYGLLARLLRQRRVGAAMSEQILLLHLEPGGAAIDRAELARRFTWRRARVESVVRRLIGRGWVAEDDGGVRLTPSGEAALERSGRFVLRHREPGESGAVDDEEAGR
jgi:manganese/zinc/iron transport system permease protein